MPCRHRPKPWFITVSVTASSPESARTKTAGASPAVFVYRISKRFTTQDRLQVLAVALDRRLAGDGLDPGLADQLDVGARGDRAVDDEPLEKPQQRRTYG